jgi:hypothetical protein
MKLIREGMEDYEYLHMVDPALAKQVTDSLFPTAYDCARSPGELESARDQLFAALDQPLPDMSTSTTGDGGANADMSIAVEGPGFEPSGCDCRMGGRERVSWGAVLLLISFLVFSRRGRRAPCPRR